MGQREHPDVELDAGHDLPGLDATDRARGDADAGRELSLAQVGEASCPNDVPARLVVHSLPAPCPGHDVRVPGRGRRRVDPAARLLTTGRRRQEVCTSPVPATPLLRGVQQ